MEGRSGFELTFAFLGTLPGGVGRPALGRFRGYILAETLFLCVLLSATQLREFRSREAATGKT